MRLDRGQFFNGILGVAVTTVGASMYHWTDGLFISIVGIGLIIYGLIILVTTYGIKK
jgi:hypothetical protein